MKITYEGCSLEAMWYWTELLGTKHIRVLAPGVYITSGSKADVARSVRRRREGRATSALA